MNSKQAKTTILEKTIMRLNYKLKTATGQTRKYLLFDLLQTHRILAKINNI